MTGMTRMTDEELVEFERLAREATYRGGTEQELADIIIRLVGRVDSLTATFLALGEAASIHANLLAQMLERPICGRRNPRTGWRCDLESGHTGEYTNGRHCTIAENGERFDWTDD